MQILACHILEAEIRAKQNLAKNNTTKSPITTLSQPSKETIAHTESTPYQDQETLEAEDLEVHQVLIEGYFAQPLQ